MTAKSLSGLKLDAIIQYINNGEHMTKQTEAMKLALEAAYLAGFNASGEGYNGEYPFDDCVQKPEDDAVWLKNRDNTLREALASEAKEQPAQKRPQNCGTGYCSCIECVMEPARPEPVSWKNAALRVGEDLCSVGPFGYYDMTEEQWLDWALSVVTVHAPPPQPPATYTCGVCGVSMQMEQLAPPQQEPVAVVSGYYGGQCVILPIDPAQIFNSNTALYTSPPPQRKPLSDAQRDEIAKGWRGRNWTVGDIIDAIEAAHGIKENT